jgi:hypothetical protein
MERTVSLAGCFANSDGADSWRIHRTHRRETGDDSMPGFKQLRTEMETGILEGPGMASPSERRAAFDNSDFAGPVGALVDKVTRHAWRVTDEDMQAANLSGLSEDQIFEIVVCAAIGQAARQYDAGLSALKMATGKE